MTRTRLFCRVALLAIVLGLTTSCAKSFPVLYAQTLPANLGATWNKNPASENIVRYVLKLDGVDLPDVLPNTTNCPTAGTTCTVRFNVPSFGLHSITVRASNLRLSGDLSSIQDSPQSAAINFTLNQAPQTTPTGLGVTQ